MAITTAPNDREVPAFGRYEPNSGSVSVVSAQIAGTSYQVRNLLLDSGGNVWGRVYKRGSNDHDGVPVLAKYDAEQHTFIVPEHMLLTDTQHQPYFPDLPRNTGVHVVADKQGGFYVFVLETGEVAYYDEFNDTSSILGQLPSEGTFGGAALAPDGDVVFALLFDTEYKGARIAVYRFTPPHYNPIAVTRSSSVWPRFNDILVDRQDRVWFGANGYFKAENHWRSVFPRSYFEDQNNPQWRHLPANLILNSSDGRLWYQKHAQDTGGSADGLAWYDPTTNRGCMVTNAPAPVVEDITGHLWIVVNKTLYNTSLE